MTVHCTWSKKRQSEFLSGISKLFIRQRKGKKREIRVGAAWRELQKEFSGGLAGDGAGLQKVEASCCGRHWDSVPLPGLARAGSCRVFPRLRRSEHSRLSEVRDFVPLVPPPSAHRGLCPSCCAARLPRTHFPCWLRWELRRREEASAQRSSPACAAHGADGPQQATALHHRALVGRAPPSRDQTRVLQAQDMSHCSFPTSYKWLE